MNGRHPWDNFMDKWNDTARDIPVGPSKIFSRFSNRDTGNADMFHQASTMPRFSEEFDQKFSRNVGDQFFGHGGDSIPITVHHERSRSAPDDEMDEERKPSDETETSSSVSQGSSNSGSSGGDVFNSHIPFNVGRRRRPEDVPTEPKVHNIPIHVEPRDSTSSGYTSDEVMAGNRPTESLSRCSSGSSQSSGRTPGSSVKKNGSRDSLDGFRYSQSPVSHNIPVHVERTSSPRPESPLRDVPNAKKATPGSGQSRRTRPTCPPQETDQRSGPHVTRIPVSHGQDEPVGVSAHPPTHQPKSTAQNDPLSMIDTIASELEDLKAKIEQFEGDHKSKEYRVLDEMLTRCMIKLDSIETNGVHEIRQRRKAAINSVHAILGMLEAKGKGQSRGASAAGDAATSTIEDQPTQSDNDDRINDVKMMDDSEEVMEQPAASQVDKDGGICANEETNGNKESENRVGGQIVDALVDMEQDGANNSSPNTTEITGGQQEEPKQIAVSTVAADVKQ